MADGIVGTTLSCQQFHVYCFHSFRVQMLESVFYPPSNRFTLPRSLLVFYWWGVGERRNRARISFQGKKPDLSS